MTARRRRYRTTPSSPMRRATWPSQLRLWPGCRFFLLLRLHRRRRQCRPLTRPGPISPARRAPHRRTLHLVPPRPRHRRRPTLQTLQHQETARHRPRPRPRRSNSQCRHADAAARARRHRPQAAEAEARGLRLHLLLRRQRRGGALERPPRPPRHRPRRPAHA
uniref:Uncharacterized protein n=1 Tax=Arundo donax TaxID=35708 RepID=A0A0A9EE49_ARUDO